MPAPTEVRARVATEGLDRPCARRTNLHLLGSIGAYAAAAVAANWAAAPIAWVAAWAVMAFVLAGAGAIAHEAVHGNLYRSRLANRATGIVAAGAVLVCWSAYRAFHLQHHAYTRTEHDPEGYPDSFARRRDYAILIFGGLMLVWRLLRHTVRTVVRGRPPFYARTASLARGIKTDAMILLGLGALLTPVAIAYPGAILKCWLVPVLLMYLTMFPMLITPEHLGGRGGVPIAENTRTVLSNAAVRWAFWNNNYHAAHHLVPSVPFYNLPRLHGLIETDPAWVESSYLRFHWRMLRSIGGGPTSARISAAS